MQVAESSLSPAQAWKAENIAHLSEPSVSSFLEQRLPGCVRIEMPMRMCSSLSTREAKSISY